MEDVLNILDYIDWRGDLPMEADGLNEVDGAVMARFSYVPFEYLDDPPRDSMRPVRELANKSLGNPAFDGRWKFRDEELMAAMAPSRRFGNLEVGYFEEKFDEKIETQFSAVTVKLSDSMYFVVFRGTDNTIVGWKEDLNMSYLCPIPGQLLAVDYLRRVASKVKGRLILGGHSKGGNLAVYAGAFCGEEIQSRVEAIFNYDGPGFFEDILKSPGYQAICPKIHTFIPQFSVVGMLLGHGEESIVVHSGETGLHQHDVYSWCVRGARFVNLGTVTGGSRFVDSAMKGWIAEMTPEQFEQFANAIYTVMENTNAHTLHEMRENWLDSALSMARSVGNMDETTRKAVIESLKMLARNATRTAKPDRPDKHPQK